MSITKIFMAPLQGFTDASMRHFHKVVYGALDGYFTPFVRIEHGDVRARDMRDITSELNANHCPTPQIIVRDGDEFGVLTESLINAGHRRVDINMGCPFVPQVRKGRGAGLLGNGDALRDIAQRIEGMEDVEFSIKMRLGICQEDEWMEVMPIINGMKLRHVTVHPRTAAEQYSGALHYEQFYRLKDECTHPVVFNGEINCPDEIDEIVTRCGGLYGVMIGRGLLRRPSLAEEWREGAEWDRTKRVKRLLLMHEMLLEYAEKHLCGEHQVLGKLLPYWEFLGNEFTKKEVKAIAKSKTLKGYKEAVRCLM